LEALGVRVECKTGCPPLTVSGGRFSAGHVAMRGDLSSQYFSALLMAAGVADRPIEIEVRGTLVSQPYVAITCQMIRDFGGEVEVTPRGFRVHPVASYRARTY